MEKFDINKEMEKLKGLNIIEKCSALDDLMIWKMPKSRLSVPRMRFPKNTPTFLRRSSTRR